MAAMERRFARNRRIRQELEKQNKIKIQLSLDEDAPPYNITAPFSIGKTQKAGENIYSFVQRQVGDPAVIVSKVVPLCNFHMKNAATRTLFPD